MPKTLLQTTLSILALSVLAAPLAQAQSADAYPSKPVTLVVPSAAGGGTDLFARLFGEQLTKATGQTFLVDNKPGANGMLGTQHVKRAAPDGYTLLFTYAAAQVANPALYKNAQYDPVKDFVPIVQIGRVGNLMLVRADSPVKTLKEFIDTVKAKPNSLSYCTWGVGSGGHLAMESLKKQAGLQIAHVPYKGNAPCIQDLLGGQVPFAFGDISSNVGAIKAGKLRALAYSGAARLDFLPDVPTMNEAGYPFNLYAWYGILAPAGTPAAVVTKVNAAVNKALADPAVQARLVAVNMTDAPQNSPQQFADVVRTDAANWGHQINELGLKLD